MSASAAFDLVFAVGTVVAFMAVVGAVSRRLERRTLLALALLELVGSTAGWIVFAAQSRHPRELAIASGGLFGCALAAGASSLLRGALVRGEQIDAQLASAQAELQTLIAREVEERGQELEQTLARARADSVSRLIEEERQIAEEHRREFAEREREIAAALTEALTTTQAQVEQRLAGWAQDLDRVAETTKAHIGDLGQRQRQLVNEIELRLAADAERLAAETEQLRTSIQRLRSDVDKALEEVVSAARTELDTHAGERRRALHELEDRLRHRERELIERIEREELEVGQRVQAGFDEVGRRQVEQLQRVVERTTSSYADEAAQQFAALVKSSREEAARRLSRELDRAVEVFAREAESVLAERLAHVGDAGARRLERRLAEATAALERQRDERLGALDGRMMELEAEIRRRVEELGADAEAERAVLEARLRELLRRVEAAGALQGS